MVSYIKHRPTVLDQLPLEIIRVYIIPYLAYEDRIHLNQCLPIWDRIPKRMNKHSIEKHEQEVIIDRLSNYLRDDLNGTPKIKAMTQFFKILQTPRFFHLIEKNTSFRQVVLKKIKELVEDLIHMQQEVELGIRLKLASELKKLRDKIDVSGPYTEGMRYYDVKPLSFV
jgi:hypothetical protein